MNGYSTLLVNTLSSGLNMNYSCTSKYFLINQIEKKNIIKMLMILDFKKYFHFELLSSIDEIIPLHVHVKIIVISKCFGVVKFCYPYPIW